MSLPLFKSFFQKRNLEALILPVFVSVFLLSILFVSVLFPQKPKKKLEEKKDISYYVDQQKVNSKGKIIGVTPRVLQITPKELHEKLIGKKKIIVVTIIKNESEVNLPHIAGTRFILEEKFNGFPPLNPDDFNVFVSKDGYDSAVVIDKFVGGIFPRERNLNLEGGLEGWKKEGLPLEN